MVHNDVPRISLPVYMMLADATSETPKFTFAGSLRSAKVVSCYDGDSFEAVMNVGDKLWKFDCRMHGYDSPEMKPLKSVVNRDAEKAAALRAKTALLSFVCDGVDVRRTYTNKELDDLVRVNKKVITLNCKEFDKYGRILVEVNLPTDTTVNAWMIANNYGYAYTGGSKKAWV